MTGAVIGEVWAMPSVPTAPTRAACRSPAPRIPCVTFQAWMGEPHWVRRFTEHGAPGAYLRVLAEGTIEAGAPVEVVDRPEHGVTVGDVFRLRFADPARLRRLLD